jgi:hypothetical protein
MAPRWLQAQGPSTLLTSSPASWRRSRMVAAQRDLASSSSSTRRTTSPERVLRGGQGAGEGGLGRQDTEGAVPCEAEQQAPVVHAFRTTVSPVSSLTSLRQRPTGSACRPRPEPGRSPRATRAARCRLSASQPCASPRTPARSAATGPRLRASAREAVSGALSALQPSPVMPHKASRTEGAGRPRPSASPVPAFLAPHP